MERPEGFLEDFYRFLNLTALARGASVGTVVTTEMKRTFMICCPQKEIVISAYTTITQASLNIALVM